MADRPLFYRSIVPLNRDGHRRLKLDQAGSRYHFAGNSHVIPAVVEEFLAAARFLPIVFVPGTSAPSPVFLVGLRPGRNAFVDPGGGWRGGYVPAFVRRYPFMLGETPEGGTLACIDETHALLNPDKGEPLFLGDGSDSPFLREKIRLLHDYQAAARRTETFTRLLQDLNLFQAVTIEANAPGGPSSALHGLLVVNESHLDALSADQFLEIRRQGFLPLIYAHIASLNTVDSLREAASGADPTESRRESGAEAVVLR